MAYVGAFSQCLVLVVFLVAAVSKIRDRRRFREFAASVAALRILPDHLVGFTAMAVAGTELVVSALLVALPAPALTAFGLGLAAALLTTFAVAIGTVIRRGVPASCRCFGGSASARLGWRHVVRNAVLGLLSMLGLFAVVRQPVIDLRVFAVMAPFALLVALLTIRLDDLAELFSSMSTTGR